MTLQLCNGRYRAIQGVRGQKQENPLQVTPEQLVQQHGVPRACVCVRDLIILQNVMSNPIFGWSYFRWYVQPGTAVPKDRCASVV